MTGPNFYTIDFAREVVLQGQSTTFITVGRDDNNLTPTDDVYIIVYPNTRTFNSYGIMNAIGSTAGVGNIQSQVIVDRPSIQDDIAKLSFNNIAPGLAIKNTYDFQDFGNANVLSVNQTDSQSFNIDIQGTNPNISTSVHRPLHFGYWDKLNPSEPTNWKLNGKPLEQFEFIAYTYPGPAFADHVTDLQNIFDGTTITIPTTLLQGTGYVGRGNAGWCKLIYDSDLPNKSATFRIDYDGNQDSHLKFNFIIFKRSQFQVASPLSPSAPLYVPESATGLNNPTSYITPQYGAKSGNATAPNVGDISTYVDYQETHFFGYTNTNIRTSRTEYQNSFVSDIKIYDDRSSYSVLKTNPKLSGNVKITLDSTGNLWLNSIDANNELADSSYKKFPIPAKSTYARDLYRFFKNGQTPPQVVYSLYQVDDQYQNTKRTLSEQYDNFYNYGVEQLKSRYYDENFSFFSPLWLRKTVPDFFIIFRLDHPLSVESYKDAVNPVMFEEFFKDARIVKTFDMREKSKLGAYLRQIVQDPRYKERGLDVSFDSDIPTTWNGFSYADGTLTGKGEFLNDYYTKDRPIIEFEEYITGGFERHGIISSNLINLEFLFDDEEATPYSINRYFGLYVTENQLANFQIDPEVIAKIPNQTPLPKPGVDGEPYSTKSFIQSNPNGIQIPVKYFHNPSGIVNNTNIPSYQGEVEGKFPLPSMVEDPLRIFYVKDREDAFKRINTLKEVDYGNPGTTDYSRVTQLQLFDNQEDMSKYAGVNQITSQFNASLLDKGHSQLRLHLSKADSGNVFADEEVLELTFNRYNHDPRIHTYYLKVKSSTLTSVMFTVFKDQYVEKLSGPFAMPAPGGFVGGLPVSDITKFAVGQQVFITSAGYFTVTNVNTGLGEIDLQNTGNPTNANPSITPVILDTEFLSLAAPTYELTYDYTPLTDVLTIDPVLSINLELPTNLYVNDQGYKIEVNSNEKQVYQLFGATNTQLDPILKNLYQQFRWKMVANSVGLQPGAAWSYPVADPNGYDYLSTFSNEGTPSQVALALAKSINSFENRPCDALAIDDTIYLRALHTGAEGNSIQITRNMVDSKSNIYNLGFYEKGNVEFFHKASVIEYPSVANPDLPVEFVNKGGIVGTSYTYLKIQKSPSGSYFQIRTNVNSASLTTASTTGDAVYYITSPTVQLFTDPHVPFSIDISNLSDYVFYEYVIKVDVGPLNVTQLFVGGNDKTKNRARIAFVDSERYYNDRRINVTGNTITGSSTISNVPSDNIYIGATVTGAGIPENTVVNFIDYGTNQIEISNVATATDSVKLTIGDFSILNNNKIKDQWYQTQKGRYSPMIGWDVQGKLVYSLPYLEEPAYDRKNYTTRYTNLGTYSVIELEDNTQEFYQTFDRKIVAYDIYRPIVGIFSIFPIKEFDFDFYFSDYSYTPILEAFRYYFNEELVNLDDTLILPADENYRLSVVKQSDESSPANTYSCIVQIDGLNPITKKWDYLDAITFDGPNSSAADGNRLILNTYYPFYSYDEYENPYTVSDATNDFYITGAGLRNYTKRIISSRNSDGSISVIEPSMYRITLKNLISVDTLKVKVTKNDYGEDKDLKAFPGFAAITDIYSPEDAEAVRGLLNDSKYVEAFLYQALRSEYDRLRENFNKEYATKSKVVPYINKWVQEGTDARDNYYRLNASRAFGITNFSPDYNVNFAEPSLLTNEFPYLDTVPKDYPTESLEGSRSYMFSKLSDNANGKTWFDLLTTNLEDDWFTKFFAVGYPTELDQTGAPVTKSRDERYTFFIYNNGIQKSQTLFRGGKIQVLDINDQLVPPAEITGSTKYNDYKFAAIARILPLTPLTSEKPVDIEIYRNDKFKSITMVINVHLQDYRIQSGLNDYLFFYAVNDQLKNYNQQQTQVNGSSIAVSTDLNVSMFLPYTGSPITPTYTNYATMRPRQGFFGGGYLELGDNRLGGYAVEVGGSSLSPSYYYSGSFLSVILQYDRIDPTYEFSVLNEIIPTLDRYSDNKNAFTLGSVLDIVPKSVTTDGSIYKLINAVKLGNDTYHIDRTNSRAVNDQYLTLQTSFGSTMHPMYTNTTTVGSGAYISQQFAQKASSFGILPGNLKALETYNIKGGTSAYVHIKNLLTYASIKEYINNDDPFIAYYKVENGSFSDATDYKLRFVAPDQIIKTGVLSYVNDEDKPIEYLASPLVGYNIVDTNQNEVIYRHRGLYEPRANDILSFWVREDQQFTEHFGKDFLLSNTHLNDKSPLSGFLRNYGINKVADQEILKIKGGGAYKSVYPLVGEIAIDAKEQFVLNSTWDKNYYRKYFNITEWNDINGIEDMQEFKSFLGSKTMNVPKTQPLDTFNSTEATYNVLEPAEVVGVKQLSRKEVSFTDVQGNTKPILTIDLDIKTRLLRKLYEDINLPTSFDEFNWLKTLGITDFDNLNSTDIERLKNEYLLKNILQLYEISEIKLYALSKEGIPLFDATLTDANKIAAGYRVDKNCKVTNLDQFTVRITKELDTKKPFGYSVSATIKRI